MPAEILSLDLDWFNTLDRDELKDGIREFFATLRKTCRLPKCVDFVPEHQYLYPWSIRLLDKLSYRTVNVVNIDEHHDFYHLDLIDFAYERSEIGCWNFFAFMAHHKIMEKYTWVTNDCLASQAVGQKSDLLGNLRTANSLTVKRFNRKIEVVNAKKVFDICRGKKFDGFMIIRSPEYTDNYRAVYNATDEALANELPKVRVRRYQCRVKFKEHRVRHRANSLFWKL